MYCNTFKSILNMFGKEELCIKKYSKKKFQMTIDQIFTKLDLVEFFFLNNS